MNSTEKTNDLLSAEKFAKILLGLFLACFAVFALMTLQDRSNRAQLERIESPSAAGDPAVLDLAKVGANKALPALTREGRPLYIQSFEGPSDDSLRKAGTDDTGKIPLYRQLKEDGSFQEGYRVKFGPAVYGVLGERQP